jgi:DNA repair exonuclease SbcCD nuclease subunit
MTRVIHTGDTHLGYAQYHSQTRREDFLAAFRQVIEDAVETDVDAVVHAGDLFHDRRPTLTDVMGTLEVLRTLEDGDIPFLAVVGNHEAKRDAQWLDLFESLGLATRLGPEPVEIGNTAFYGLDFVPRANRDDLELAFDSHDREHAALVTHGLFKPFDHGDWDARELLGATDVPIDALLLGDDHTADTARVDETWVTYCGSTDRAAADEREERGYNLVTFDGDVGIARRGLETREFVYCDLELARGEGIERVRQRIDEHDVEDAVVVIHLDGDGEPVPPAGIEEYGLDKGALAVRVSDRREFADEASVDVSFADPDEAVTERVRELGLSEAARDIDETIRASKVADSNVADTVEATVRDLVEAGDASAFEAMPPTDEPADADQTTGASPPDESAVTEESREAAVTDATDETPTDTAEQTETDVDDETMTDAPEQIATDAADETATDAAADQVAPDHEADGSAESSDAATEDTRADDEGTEDSETATDDQASMEEFL